jgi:hypothetical protein
VVLIDFIIAFVIATMVVLAFVLAGWRQPLRGLLWALFLILLLLIWAGGIWLQPIGPAVVGVSLLSFVVVGLLLALLFAAFVPRTRPRTRGEALRQVDTERAANRVVSVFFWILVAMLVAVILYRYM